MRGNCLNFNKWHGYDILKNKYYNINLFLMKYEGYNLIRLPGIEPHLYRL